MLSKQHGCPEIIFITAWAISNCVNCFEIVNYPKWILQTLCSFKTLNWSGRSHFRKNNSADETYIHRDKLVNNVSCQQNQIAFEQAKPTINKNRKQNTVTTKGCVFFCKPYSKVDMWIVEPGRKLFIKERKVTVHKTQKNKMNKAAHT